MDLNQIEKEYQDFENNSLNAGRYLVFRKRPYTGEINTAWCRKEDADNGHCCYIKAAHMAQEGIEYLKTPEEVLEWIQR